MQIQLSAIPIVQNNQTIFLSKLSYGSLLRLDREELLQIANDPTQSDVAQRKPKPAKVRAIAVYILNRLLSQSIYFAPLLLNILPAPSLELLNDQADFGWLKIPYSFDSQTRLIDGQHRLLGIRQAVEWIVTGNWPYLQSIGVLPEVVNQFQRLGEKSLAQLTALQIGVQIYGGLTVEEERQAFHDTNRLLDKAEPTLCLTFDSSKPINALARRIAEQCRWFIQRVSFYQNSMSDNPEHLMTFSTLVQATKLMFPVEPPVAADLQPYVEWAVAFWNAAGDHLPGLPWREQDGRTRKVQRSESMATQAVTFLALGKLANYLRLQQVSIPELPDQLKSLSSIVWERSDPAWASQGILSQNPKSGKTVISNTRVFVDRLADWLIAVVMG
jgi:DNA-sulfur modification-associated